MTQAGGITLWFIMNTLDNISLLTNAAQRDAILAAAALLCVVLLFFTIRRQDKRRLWLRIPVTILAILCFLLIGLRPYQLVSEKAFKATLLTAGFERGVVDSLLVEMPDIQLFSTTAVLGFDKQVRQIPDANYLTRNEPRLEEVFVVGNGISPYELAAFDSLKTTFLLNEIPEGITKIGYRKTLSVDEVFSVQGEYQHTNDSTFWLVLEGQSGATDSLKIDAAQSYFFDLNQTVKKKGRYLFHLVVKDANGRERQREHFPVFVLPKEKLNLVIINLAPSFESKYLKNTLSDRGHRVAVRSTVTRGKFRTEFVNQDAVNLKEISRELLAKTNVFISTTAALEKMNSRELNDIQAEIKRGMGCIIWGDDAVFYSKLTSSQKRFFLNFSLIKSQEKTMQFIDNQKTTSEKFNLPVSKFSFSSKEKTFAEGAAAYTQKGEGRVALLRSNQTYKMRLDGKNELYDALWTEILSTTNRPKITGDTWTANDGGFAFTTQPIDLELTTTTAPPTGEITDPNQQSTTFYLAQHPYNPEQWQGRAHLRETGWHTLYTRSRPRDTHTLYVHDHTHDWQTLQIAQGIRANHAHQAQKSPENFRKPTLQKNVVQRLPLWWFYIGLLVCWTVLWLEEKV